MTNSQKTIEETFKMMSSLSKVNNQCTLETMSEKFDPRLFNSKCNNLLGCGYDEYLTTLEDGVTHSIFTNTNVKSIFNGSVCDIYSDGRIEYSMQ